MIELNNKVNHLGTNLLERLCTPKELNDRKILSYVQQWKERERGRLKCYRIGRKILYSEHHLSEFFSSCETK